MSRLPGPLTSGPGTVLSPAAPPASSTPPVFRRKSYEPVGEEWSTPDCAVHIDIPGGSTSRGPSIFVTTPTTSCPQTEVGLGEALLVPEARGSSWTRIIVLDLWTKDVPAHRRTGDEAPFDMYAKLLVDQGPDHAPRGKRCG